MSTSVLALMKMNSGRGQFQTFKDTIAASIYKFQSSVANSSNSAGIRNSVLSLLALLNGYPLSKEIVVDFLSALLSLMQVWSELQLNGYFCGELGEVFAASITKLSHFFMAPPGEVGLDFLVSLCKEQKDMYVLVSKLKMLLLPQKYSISSDLLSSFQKCYIKAWKSYGSFNYIEALKVAESFDEHQMTTFNSSLLELLKSCCYVNLDCPTLALMKIRSVLESSLEVMVFFALLISSYIFSKWNFSYPFFLEELLLNSSGVLPQRICTVNISSDDVFLVKCSDFLSLDTYLIAGLKALKVKRFSTAKSIINEGIKLCTSSLNSKLFIGNLLILQACLLENNFKNSWEKICKIVFNVKEVSQCNIHQLFQLYFFGGYAAFCLFKLRLSKRLCYQCLKIGNYMKKYVKEKSVYHWILNVQGYCLTLISMIMLGRNNLKKGEKFIKISAFKEREFESGIDCWTKGLKLLKERQNMNFQGLLHDTLLASGHVESCAIFKKKDFSVIAASIGYEPELEQVKTLSQAFENPYLTRDQNIHFSGATYKCIKADKYSIYATKGESGFVCVKTNLYLVFGSYSSHMFASVCSEAVEKLGDYLIDKGL